MFKEPLHFAEARPHAESAISCISYMYKETNRNDDEYFCTEYAEIIYFVGREWEEWVLRDKYLEHQLRIIANIHCVLVDWLVEVRDKMYLVPTPCLFTWTYWQIPASMVC